MPLLRVALMFLSVTRSLLGCLKIRLEVSMFHLTVIYIYIYFFFLLLFLPQEKEHAGFDIVCLFYSDFQQSWLNCSQGSLCIWSCMLNVHITIVKLLGTARTSLVVTIGPSPRHRGETASTIMFGQRVRFLVLFQIVIIRGIRTLEYENNIKTQVIQLLCRVLLE
jgi:hypothetical protein